MNATSSTAVLDEGSSFCGSVGAFVDETSESWKDAAAVSDSEHCSFCGNIATGTVKVFEEEVSWKDAVAVFDGERCSGEALPFPLFLASSLFFTGTLGFATKLRVRLLLVSGTDEN
jgi:hypothetical protein